ncbi:uncharacterized protein LOC141630823 [Silene latifolia]|uniref:uncharacterized protein LOC141630823 n=1 Tax=Silene latifolia TaxID=37657 RepID=UPI003D76EB08
MIQEFIRLNSLPITQIAPYAWRILLSTVALNNSWDAGIGLSDLAHRLECRSLGNGQYTFRAVEKTENFLQSAAKGKDDGWYEDFFYVKLDSLPIHADYLFEHWIFAKKLKNPEKSEDEEASVAKLFSILEDRRLFPILLSGLDDSITEETISSGKYPLLTSISFHVYLPFILTSCILAPP